MSNYDIFAPSLFGMLFKIIPDKKIAFEKLIKVFDEEPCTKLSNYRPFVQLTRCMIKILIEQNYLIHIGAGKF